LTIRLTLIIVLIIVSCKNETDLIFSAVKENISLNIEGNLAIDELIKKSNDLKCDDFRIVANSLQNIDLNKSEFVLFAKCPNRIIHHDGIQMPIYECNGFRDHGINLCDDYMTNIEKLKEFYINPKKRTYYPSNPRRAIVKIIVDESQTLNSIIPLIKH